MRASSNGLKSATLKKKISNNANSPNTNQQLSQMNKTSLSSLSSSSSIKSQDKLSQLKQKLQKERQNMRKSGRRFKESLNTSTQIQIQTQEQQIKPITSKQLTSQNKKSTAVGISTSTSSDLYDFGTIKSQIQNKTNKLFMKRPSNSKKDLIVPVYTTQQIINSTSGPVISQKNIKIQNKISPQSNQRPVPLQERKRQTVNLMQLSAVIQKSPNKVGSSSKQKTNTSLNQKSKQNDIKFFDPTKVKKTNNSSQNSIVANSRVFESAIKQQKKRNKQIEDFLSKIGLQSFAESFINLGFDQVQTLIEVQVDDLNQMMMRARQQDNLMKLIKQYKLKNQIEDLPQKPLIDRPTQIKSRIGFRPKSAALTTEPSESNQISENSRLRSTTQNFNMSESSLVSKSSIFYLMGGSDWSLQSQIRKACSGCFKVSYQGVRRGDCYYCQNCDPGELDELQISLNQSMVRSYY